MHSANSAQASICKVYNFWHQSIFAFVQDVESILRCVTFINEIKFKTTYFTLKSSAARRALSIWSTKRAFSAILSKIWKEKRKKKFLSVKKQCCLFSFFLILLVRKKTVVQPEAASFTA